MDRVQARRRALRHLLARLFDNSPGLLVPDVLEHERLYAAELVRLRQRIDEAGR